VSFSPADFFLASMRSRAAMKSYSAGFR
jgi:hypothetical protein